MEEGAAHDDLHVPLLGESGGEGGGGGAGEGGGAASSDASSRRSTLSETLFNFLNIFVGTGLQSMPYALAKGGWAALLVLSLLMPLFALSGQLIVWAFDLMPPGAAKTYPELGRAVAGRHGVRAVLLCSFLELFGGSIILVLVSWRMLGLLLPPGLGPLSALQLVALVSTLCQAPLLFVDLKRLSKLAMVGLTSSALVIAMVLSLIPLDPHRAAMPQQPPPGHHLASAGLIQAVGIFALSSTAHSTLPALRIAMRQPARFPLALALGFTAMLSGYATLAAVGYWYFGDSAAPLVADSLAVNSVFTASRFPVHRVLAAMVLVNSWTKVPGLLLVLQDMLLSVLRSNRTADEQFHPPVLASAIRLGLFGAATLLALTAYQVLGATLSLLGGLASISCSLLLPTAFYASLSWRRQGWAARAGLAALLALGAALIALVTTTSLCDMTQRCGAHHGGGGNAWGGVLALAAA